MATFIGRRLLYLLPVLFAVTLLTFLIASLLPGDLASTMLGDQATPEKVEALRAQMGLDLPIWQRYGIWLWDVLHGNLGRSFRTGETVWAAVTDRLPVSLELMAMTVALGLVIAIPLAIFCAVKSGTAVDRFFTGLAFGKLSLPSYMVAILLIYLFAVELNWLGGTAWGAVSRGPAGAPRSFLSSTCSTPCSTRGSAMAVLDIEGGGDTAVVSAVRRQRRVGLLFIGSVAWIVLIGLAAIFADWLPIASPTDMDLLAKRAPPGSENHILGADHLGRDELSRLIHGGRVSLTVGLLAPVIGVTIGGCLGMLAGYFRGRLETFAVGGVDVLLAFPPLVFALAVTAYLGQSVTNITLVIGVLGIPA